MVYIMWIQLNGIFGSGLKLEILVVFGWAEYLCVVKMVSNNKMFSIILLLLGSRGMYSDRNGLWLKQKDHQMKLDTYKKLRAQVFYSPTS